MKKTQKILIVILGIITILDFFITLIYVSFPKKYQEEVEAASVEFGVDKSLIYSIIKVESNFNAKAISTAGAIGLMQIKPSTGEYIFELLKQANNKFVENKTEFDLFNPETNIFFGTYYFKYLLNKFGNETTAIAAYNAGEGVVRSWLGNNNELNPENIPFKETRDYINKIRISNKFYKILDS